MNTSLILKYIYLTISQYPPLLPCTVPVTAGEMTFKEFVSELNTGDDDVSSDNDDSEVDEDWKPPGKKAKQTRYFAQKQEKFWDLS